jgi:hypothetical protein
MCARDERFTESAMSSGGGRDVSTAKEGWRERQLAFSRSQNCMYQAAPLHTSTEFPREPPIAIPAIAEAHVTCAAHTAALLPLPYAINQATAVKMIPIIILCSVPWEWEVSADLFVRNVACKCCTASADECWQTQRSDSSPRGFMI